MRQPRLYPLLPAWYRGQDAAMGRDVNGRAPIESWLARVEASFQALHAASSEAYDDWFVETCAPELLPALGGLVGVELEGPVLAGDRRLVANAIRRWRSKGSLWALRDALEAASGWPVEIHEFENELLATGGTRRPGADARRVTSTLGGRAGGGPNLRRIGVRVRRGFAVIVEDADAAQRQGGWYSFDAGGLAIPVPEGDSRVRVRSAGELVAFSAPDAELRRHWQSDSERVPAGSAPLLDAARGRFWLPQALRERVRVDAVCWRGGPIGAGLPGVDFEPPRHAWRALVSRDFTDDELGPGCFRRIEDALAAWPAREDADLRILDSGIYPEVIAPLHAGHTLTLQAQPGEMPCVAGIRITGALRLSGILVAGNLEVRGASAEICACSVRGTVSLGGGRIERSLVGPIEVTAAGEIAIVDSVVAERALAEHASRSKELFGHELPSGTSLTGSHIEEIALRSERSTFLGAVHAGEVTLARDSLFRGLVTLSRAHTGRFDHCPHPRGSQVARDAARSAFDPADAPQFASHFPGSAGYACLTAPAAMLESASDGGEPGAFHGLHVRERRARLEQQLARFLPAGFEASVEVSLEGMNG